MMDTADSYRVDSEGSEEKLLLDDSDTEQTEETEIQSDDGEEDDIVKLMGFDKNSSDDTLGKKQRTYKPLSRSENTNSSLADIIVCKKVKTEPTKEEMKISLPVTSKRPASTAILDRHERMRKIYKKHNSQTGKMVCGIMCIFIILGIGIVCLFFAHTAGMKDLYIIGGIFTGGGSLFTLSFIVLRCTVDKRNADRDYSALFKTPVE